MIERVYFLPLFCLGVLASLISCGDSRNALSDSGKVEAVVKGTFTDSRDGQIYRTVKIGEQVWMAENLNYEMENSYCYGDKAINCVRYGRLYSLKSARKACPAEWRLPTPADWGALILSAGGELVAGKKLKSKEGWIGGGNGTDDYGFSIFPAGTKYGNAEYDGEGKSAFFWGWQDDYGNGVHGLLLNYYNSRAELKSDDVQHWHSIRCVKQNVDSVALLPIDSLSSSSVAEISSSSSSSKELRASRMEGSFLIDLRDNQVYKTVKIGTQTWMAENLNYEMTNSSCNVLTCAINGRSYKWNAAKDACPAGWHLPTQTEWKTLISKVGGERVAGKLLRAKSGHWSRGLRPGAGPMYEFYEIPGSDDYGFAATEEKYWSSTDDSEYYAYNIYMTGQDGSAKIEQEYKESDLYVRCLLGELPQKAENLLKNVVTGTLMDPRDGKNYKTVKIGSQTWMAENINYETEESFCYENDESNCSKFGRLYQWDSAIKSCPAGWHLPSIDEWRDLIIAVGNRTTAGVELKSRVGWGDSVVATDVYGFSALPAGFGYKEHRSYIFYNKGIKTEWWTTSLYEKKSGRRQSVALGEEAFEWSYGSGLSMHSVRCLKDVVLDTPPEKIEVLKSTPIKDERDGNTYQTVKIGSQTWMAENLKYESPESFCHGDSAVNCSKYGRFYTWNAAIGCADKWIDEDGDGWGYRKICNPQLPVQGVCPAGWHLPSLREWTELIASAGGEDKAGIALRSKNGWADEKNGTDDYGFSAIPFVYNKDYKGVFTEKNNMAEFWSSTFYDGSREASYMGLTTENKYCVRKNERELYVCLFENRANLVDDNKGYKKSVRCVKDVPVQTKEEKWLIEGRKTKEKSSSAVSARSGVQAGKIGSFVDPRDGQNYKTVKIGTQTWMARNLNYDMKGSICNEDSVTYCSQMGRTYGWSVAKEACPTGWRLPTQTDWDTLFTAIGGQSVAAKTIKSSSGWYGYGNGSDDYGFSAFSGGSAHRNAFFWSYTEANEDSAYAVYLRYYSDNALMEKVTKDAMFPVRCLKGEPPKKTMKKMIESSPLNDARDGQTYRTVKIGSQTWMAENLNYKTDDSYCFKDADSNCVKYGRYYTWSAAMDSAGVYSTSGKGCGREKSCIPTSPVRGVCPAGWHLPSLVEWNALVSAVGGRDSAGLALKTMNSWIGRAEGVDDYGFSALPAGYVTINEKDRRTFENESNLACYWSSTEVGYEEAYVGLKLNSYSDYSSLGKSEKRRTGHNVRCVKDFDGQEKDALSSGTLSSTLSSSDSKVTDSRGTETIESMTDPRDGQIYKTVKIGKQTWMAENLNYETELSECLEDKALNCSRYGRLYPWSVAMDSAAIYSENGKGCGFSKACIPAPTVQGVCPDGWHLPTFKEWKTLVGFVGGPSSVKMMLKSSVGWENGDNGENKFGFSALPSGLMHQPGYIDYGDKSNAAFFWSSTKYDADDAFSFALRKKEKDGPYKKLSKNSSLSVRCIKNDSIRETNEVRREESMTDPRDGRTYKTVKIGDYTWMAENMKFDTGNTVCYDDDPVNCANYGRLYEWKALKTVCPAGWHLPTDVEWNSLFSAVGGQSVAGKKLKSTDEWFDCGLEWFDRELKSNSDGNGNGSDDYGFSVRPAGIFYGGGNETEKAGYTSCFHTAEKDDNSVEFEMCFNYCADSVERTRSYTYRALSVRCIKDYSGQKTKDEKRERSAHVVPPSKVVKGTFVDPRDKQTYKTVKIGKQTWMAQNLNYETKNSRCLNDESDICKEIGRNYIWTEAVKACPAGWHLPTDEDWNTLINAVGDSTTAARALKSNDGWWP